MAHETTLMLPCTGCGISKPSTQFRADPRFKRGFRGRCRECTNAYQREYQARNPEVFKASRERAKVENPESLARSKRKWATANPDKIRGQKKRAYWRQPEKYRADARAWADANPDRKAANDKAWHEANRDRCREHWRKYSQSHPERCQRGNAARRARLNGAPVNDLTTDQWREILAEAGGRCAYCGEDRKLTQDHVIPLSRGGSHTASNVVAACGPCNYSKGTKLVEEWLSL